MLPQAVKAVLWSYDTEKIDLQKDRNLIIFQVLNFGNKEATDWAIINYGKKEIKEIAQSIPLKRWNKKSLAFWSFILDFKLDSIKNRFE